MKNIINYLFFTQNTCWAKWNCMAGQLWHVAPTLGSPGPCCVMFICGFFYVQLLFMTLAQHFMKYIKLVTNIVLRCLKLILVKTSKFNVSSFLTHRNFRTRRYETKSYKAQCVLKSMFCCFNYHIFHPYFRL